MSENKKTKEKRFELRLTERDLNQLKIRAKLYAGGNVSKLIRYWIKNGSVPKGDHQ